jgi:hypothetical protein
LVVLNPTNRLGRKEPNMIIIGVDFHPEFQQIASVDTDTGEFQEKRLGHREEAETFYRGLAAAGQKVRVGMEASGRGGSNDCWPSSRLNSGSEMRQKSEPDEYESRRRIGRMRS